MKMREVAVDIDRVEHGDWINVVPEMQGLRLKVRGTNNKDWRKLQAKLLDAVPRKKRMTGRIDPDEAERITNLLLLNCSLIDWDGLEDDDGKPIPYSRDMAETLLTDPSYRRFRDAVANAANLVGEQNAEDVEDASGNLVALSLGPSSGERKLKAS